MHRLVFVVGTCDDAVMSRRICPECGSPRATFTKNPDRYSLPTHHAVCDDCWHEWDTSLGDVQMKRYGQS